MKEIKSFFTKDNRLNKGYAKIANPREPDNNFYRKKFEHLLPPIDLISEYENINPGTFAKLMDMAQQELHHKHAVDLVSLENYNRATKMGRIFALIFIGLVCITTICLSIVGQAAIALVFSCSAFLAVGITSILSSKKFFRREHTLSRSH